MTIHDYIKKQGLTKWRTWPVVTNEWTPVFFTAPDSGEFVHTDQFEIYANADHSHFVSLNTTRQLFRIIHYDLIVFHSKWESMQPGLDYTALRKL
jgi:hypothetical protein